MNTNPEVIELIETLHRAEQRLEELTAGEVDSVMSGAGHTFLLREAQDRLRHSEAVQQSVNIQLAAVNAELEMFSYSVSHDLRAPLRHIIGYVEMLMQDAGPLLPAESLRHLNIISASATRMGKLIDDLLVFSQTARSQLCKLPFDANELVRETLADIQQHVGERHIAWIVHPLPLLRADRALLRMVLVNLISNAVKFTAGRAEARIEIGCVADAAEETVVFIRDNGAGFDQKYADKLFGVFQRLHTQAEFEGTGIGLANVQRIVHRHGGRVWAQGRVGEGATFYFSIPA